MDANTETQRSVNELAAAGVTKMRKVIWANKMDHISIDIVDGKPGIWAKLYCPMNMALSGVDPVSIIWYQMDFDAAVWVPYTGPAADSAEYLAERDRCTELMSSSGNFQVTKARVENDCEDQGMSNIREGCNKWPCTKEPLVKAGIGWKCTKCGGSY